MYEFMMVISDQNINLILLSDIIQKDSEKVQYLNTFWFRQRLILKLESVFEGEKKLSFFVPIKPFTPLLDRFEDVIDLCERVCDSRSLSD